LTNQLPSWIITDNTLIAIDEPEQCLAHSDRWVEHAEEQWQQLGRVGRKRGGKFTSLPKIHRSLMIPWQQLLDLNNCTYRNWWRKQRPESR